MWEGIRAEDCVSSGLLPLYPTRGDPGTGWPPNGSEIRGSPHPAYTHCTRAGITAPHRTRRFYWGRF